MESHSFDFNNFNFTQPNLTEIPLSNQHLLPLQSSSIRSKEHLYNLICSSILPHSYSNLEPLCIGNMGDIFLSREDYKSTDFDEQDWITLEMCLSIASECRRKIILISTFLQQNIVKNVSIKSNLIQNECLKPIKNVLQNFLDEMTKSVQQKRRNFKDSWELFNFLTNYAKQIDPIFSTFQNILSTMCVLSINDSLNFWKIFLQEKINLWDNNKILKWQDELFEGFVHLIGKSLFEELFSSPTINLFNFFAEPDHYLLNMISFLHRCLELMPKNMRDSLPLFDNIFNNFWENAKEKNCVRYTSTFLSLLIRQSLDKFSIEINKLVLNELHSSYTILSLHLENIKQFYSLNIYSLCNLFNSSCTPPFENFSKNSTFETNKCTDWSIVEKEVKKQLGNIDKEYINIFYKNQNWSISVFLIPNIYESLDNIFLRLYRLIHSWHLILNFSKALEINSRKKGILIFSINIKTQIRRRLFLKIVRFLQIVIEAILGQFNTLNTYYTKKLIEQVNNSNTLLQRLIEITNEWSESLDSLEALFSDMLREPLDEIVKIVQEGVEKSQAINENSVKNTEDDDYEVKKYLSLQSRLQRVYLYTINVEYIRKNEKIFSIGEEPPKTENSLFIIKMMLST